jgi:hypothetical protein
MVLSGNMARRKRDGSHSSLRNKVVQDLEWNEENGYPDPDANKTKINYAKEPNESHKNTLKEEMLQIMNEICIELLLNMVNQNVQESLKKFQDNKLKNKRKHKNK